VDSFISIIRNQALLRAASTLPVLCDFYFFFFFLLLIRSHIKMMKNNLGCFCKLDNQTEARKRNFKYSLPSLLLPSLETTFLFLRLKFNPLSVRIYSAPFHFSKRVHVDVNVAAGPSTEVILKYEERETKREREKQRERNRKRKREA